MATNARRVRAIQRLLRKRVYDNDKEGVLLKQIEQIASGKVDTEEYFRPPKNENLADRLKGEKPKKREDKGGRNRKETGGETRSTKEK